MDIIERLEDILRKQDRLIHGEDIDEVIAEVKRLRVLITKIHDSLWLGEGERWHDGDPIWDEMAEVATAQHKRMDR